MRKEKSLGTDELGCLAKYLIFHLSLQDKGNTFIHALIFIKMSSCFLAKTCRLFHI